MNFRIMFRCHQKSLILNECICDGLYFRYSERYLDILNRSYHAGGGGRIMGPSKSQLSSSESLSPPASQYKGAFVLSSF